jgi:hypothetical protein
MEQVVIGLVMALLKVVPPLIVSIRASKALSDEEKKAALDALSAELDDVRARVAAVKFRDV